MVKRSGRYVDLADSRTTASSWLDEVRSFVRPRPELVLKPAQCALLVVDMLNYFAHPDGAAYLPATDVATARIAQLVAHWRSLGAPLFFTQHCHQGPHDLGMLGRFFSDCIRCGTWESRIVEALAPQPNEKVITKTTYDSFFGTGLEEMVRDSAATQILVTGCLTHMCCETTARSAFVRGFEVYVSADGCASSCERLHVDSLLSMADSVAIIMSCEEVEKACTR